MLQPTFSAIANQSRKSVLFSLSTLAVFCTSLYFSSLVFAQTDSGRTLSNKSNDLSNAQWSGIYPHLASFNKQGECGTGAVVPWANRLWWVTYAPHQPDGSDDKLYSIDADFNFQVFDKSIGGTPANRMIHTESQQLFIGPYVINADGDVRVIPYSKMYGRPTGNARHLTDPANKIYLATMEEGFYEIDVKSLAVNELWRDEQKKDGRHANLPGYHGKGFYSGQGFMVYANNGEHGEAAKVKPDVPSGVLAAWDGIADKWNVVKRNQFTEVTGPNGIYGSKNPETDPIWTIGWDHRSLILGVLDHRNWSFYRLPKASHAYDGAHGWNTEWPRIREIGENEMLMTMHGMFWRFPKSFSSTSSAGIQPRSTYLKIVGDFCRWKDRIVLGCDDAAKAEFLNTRRAKGKLAGPAQSQSNLCFLSPEELDSFGAPIGRGAVWLQDSITPKTPSEPFMFNGFDRRSLHLVHDQKDKSIDFQFEVDLAGNGTWKPLKTVTVPATGYLHVTFPPEEKGTWIRITSNDGCKATAWFEFRNDSTRHDPHLSKNGSSGLERKPARQESNPSIFSSLITASEAVRQLGLDQQSRDMVGALLRAGDMSTGLQVLSSRLGDPNSTPTSYQILTPKQEWNVIDDKAKQDEMAQMLAIPKNILKLEGNSILYVDDDGARYRLPIGNSVFKASPELLGMQRISREVTTERDLFQSAGIFYELPARNAGGFLKIRPIATHPYFIQDYCSWRGLLVLSGIDRKAIDALGKPSSAASTQHVVSNKDQSSAVWLGSVDDLWRLGKPKGTGGPWEKTAVQKDQPSDPYLMTGFDAKSMRISHSSPSEVTIRAQIDITGSGLWVESHQWKIPAGKELQFSFPDSFEAYWIRFVSDTDTTATVELDYQ